MIINSTIICVRQLTQKYRKVTKDNSISYYQDMVSSTSEGDHTKRRGKREREEEEENRIT